MKTTIREMQDPFALRFNDNAMSRMEITRAANANMVTGIGEYEKSAKTCYGVLSVNPETNTLQNNDGTACPAPSVFVTIKTAGEHATPEFWTCSNIVRVTNYLKNSVTLVTNGFARPLSTREEQRKAGMTKTVFWYANG